MKTSDFDAIRLRIASPDAITRWSHGEVTRPETINYRTQKPEKDGLFCEKIFGPSKDWECYCGKYKKIRYKGIVCDKCGVEVTRSLVRRERMGHIGLAAPVSHIWFLRGVPSKISILLDISVQSLEKVIYFANFIVISVNKELKHATSEEIGGEYKSKRRSIEQEFERSSGNLGSIENEENRTRELKRLTILRDEKIKELDEAFSRARQELDELKEHMILTEHQYQDYSLKYGHVFEAGIGAEAIRTLLEGIDLERGIELCDQEIDDASPQKRDRLIRRKRLLQSFLFNGLRPEWMILTKLPVIPADLRPMVPLDGGRYATSDLNDLYRRVINRNNRLKQLIELNAPDVICRNEKRMLQEAVDALLDNSARQGKTVVASTGQKRMLKSLADVLKGKQGRFRQNLLGKRTDYSGRSVIVVGPHLKLHQCGLPKTMALELYKPFIMSKLISMGIVHNVRSAGRYIEAGKEDVWDILEQVAKDSYVLLNRAPTLHRLGIQAFQPVLIEGRAIQIHPMVCSAFNADFDGDQMAVHLPLTEEAKAEARDIMLSAKNLLKPATGDPVATPNQDVVWGCYYMTSFRTVGEQQEKRMNIFPNKEDAITAYQLGAIHLRDRISVRPPLKPGDAPSHDLIETSVGRILLNAIFPQSIEYRNAVMDKKSLEEVVRLTLEREGVDPTAKLLDDIKELSFYHLTRSGLSWGVGDLPRVEEKYTILDASQKQVNETQQQYEMGLLTHKERTSKIIAIWTEARNVISQLSKKALDAQGSVYSMIESGARGSWVQLTQIIGMKGLVTNPTGEIIELPIKGSFQEGFDVLEYFISTHGARKGLSDTALRTANAGYLTRRLVDVSQDVVITQEDCGDTRGFELRNADYKEIGKHVVDVARGRVLLEDVKVPKSRKILARAGSVITSEVVDELKKHDVETLAIRSILNCRTRKGVCKACYGFDLGYNKMVEYGTAVGIIAAQSIGEPGTQLTMRTFHTGGVAGQDITQGLPRVEELFECRPPKHAALLASHAGVVHIREEDAAEGKLKKILVEYDMDDIVWYTISDFVASAVEPFDSSGNASAITIMVKAGETVEKSQVLATRFDGEKLLARAAGQVMRADDQGIETGTPLKGAEELLVTQGKVLLVKDGERVERGQQLTEGSVDLQQLYITRGRVETQRYVLKEIQHIYASQGQRLNSKHIEVIARQMFSRVMIEDNGDTTLLAGEVVERAELEDANGQAYAKKKQLAQGQELLLGITKVSLTTRSFLSAASFQETARVLINAAVSGKVDPLEGLKENVIIGRLIPVGTGFRPQQAETPLTT